MKEHSSSPAVPMIAMLPFRSEQISHPEFNYDVSVWRSVENLCERQGDSACDTIAGLFYGSAEDNVATFCPRHFYEMHFGADAPYRLTAAAEDRREGGLAATSRR